MEIRLTSGKTIPLTGGENVLSALKRHGIYLVSSCGGKGTCGKCKVRLVEGAAETASYGKLTPKEREGGFVLACQCRPSANALIEIPESSRLVIGDKIAVSRSRDLFEHLKSFGTELKPLVQAIDLRLPPPGIEDNISDLERLKRALEKSGLRSVRFSHPFAETMAAALRETGWNVTLGYVECASSGCAGDIEAISVRPSGGGKRYGAAVDIGTTTVVLYLVDLTDGRLVDVGLTYNSQIRYGDDVITRIVHAAEGSGGAGLHELREAVVTDINDLLRTVLERHKLNRSDVDSATVAGNTTMTHIFWGLNPAHIREEPYIPTLNSFPLWRAGTAGLEINPQAPLYTLPCVASYVGGDIVAGVLASKMHRSAELALFMDIGTNGEIALGNDEWLVAAACSAGPCFEGSGIRHGMRATEGAIESVGIEPLTLEPRIGTIGNAEAAGVCGSGMIDAISEMFLRGVIDRKGKFKRESTGRIRQGEEGLEYLLYGGKEREIVLTEADIENVLRAKAAIYAGASLLLKEMGLAMEDVERVYIAGGFGNYLNIKKAVILGMLPDLPLERFSFIGNASVTGAYLTLLSGELRGEAEAVASKMTYMELSVSRGFMEEYMSAMFLPHTDMERFPTVKKAIGEQS